MFRFIIKMIFGDYVHTCVIILQFSFLCNMLTNNGFSKSFIDDGFCISNKDKHFLYQSHALSFYSDTFFALILSLIYKYLKVHHLTHVNYRLLHPVKENASAVFLHGLGHLNLALRPKQTTKNAYIYTFDTKPKRIMSILVMYNFWFFLIKAAYLNGTMNKWKIHALFHTICLNFFIPKYYSFTYVQTTLMLIASISELNSINKDINYNIKALIVHLPITFVGWIEAVYCDHFIHKYGGHLIYDTTIPISIILYVFILLINYKKRQFQLKND